jgi:starch-binding outer membrane protein, SusD/RagB family
MKINIKNAALILGSGILLLGMGSCTNDLNRQPIVQVTSDVVYSNPASIEEALAKLYAGLSLSGQDVTNYPDIATSDVGSNVFLRNYWEAQELPTDEAVIGWNDQDLQAYHSMDWTPNGYFDQLMYDRVFFEVSACNEFLRETENLSSSFSPQDTTNIAEYRLEARYLRAFAYWCGMDLFGSIPFTTENDPVGSFAPPQISRDSLFNYIVSELQDIQGQLPPPGQNQIGRADQGAAWMLLAELYLNAQVYTAPLNAPGTGTAMYTQALTYCNKIINSGVYNLAPNYADLFETDNETTSHEIIFPIRANGLTSQSYGNTSFVVHAEIGGNMNSVNFGLAAGSGWAGLRTTSAFVNLFSDPSGNTDHRAMFFTNGQTLKISNIGNFPDGYAISKFTNLSSTGVPGSDPSGEFVDTDFPFFRLGEVYLIYAECVLRGGSGGDINTAVNYINLLRERAYGNTSGDITASDLTLPFILDERGRELYWEGKRRTDLIRFGDFTSGNYLWPFKGGVADGTAVDSRYNLYPISATDMLSNPNLVQNPGY